MLTSNVSSTSPSFKTFITLAQSKNMLVVAAACRSPLERSDQQSEALSRTRPTSSTRPRPPCVLTAYDRNTLQPPCQRKLPRHAPEIEPGDCCIELSSARNFLALVMLTKRALSFASSPLIAMLSGSLLPAFFVMQLCLVLCQTRRASGSSD